MATSTRSSVYSTALHQSIKTQAATLKALALESASTTGTAIEVIPGIGTFNLHLTAAAGQTSLDVTVESGDDNSNFKTVGTFTQQTGTTGDAYVTCAVSRYVRYKSVIVGTSFTYSVIGKIYGG